MSNLVNFPNHRLALEEASAWLVRMDRGLSAEESRELKDWLARSPVHRKALADAVAVWDDVDMIAELSEIFPLERYVDRKAEVTPRHAPRWLAPLAAMVLLGAGGAWYAWDTGMPGAEPDVAPAYYQTAIGQQTAISLPDGSRVTLNTETRIEVLFTDASRTLRLVRGEAYFDVAHDESRPFVVEAGERSVRAVGTAFSVRMRRDGLGVTVTDGIVQLSSPRPDAGAPDREQARLVAGDIAVVDGSGVVVRQAQSAALEASLAWRQGMLVFSDEPLELALAEFARYSAMEFVFADNSIRSIPVGGYFRIGDVEGLLLALENNFQIRVERDSTDRVVLRAR